MIGQLKLRRERTGRKSRLPFLVHPSRGHLQAVAHVLPQRKRGGVATRSLVNPRRQVPAKDIEEFIRLTHKVTKGERDGYRSLGTVALEDSRLQEKSRNKEVEDSFDRHHQAVCSERSPGALLLIERVSCGKDHGKNEVLDGDKENEALHNHKRSDRVKCRPDLAIH